MAAAQQFDDLAVGPETDAPTQEGVDADQPAGDAAAEPEIKLDESKMSRTKKRRRAPLDDNLVVGARGFLSLHELSWEVMRGKGARRMKGLGHEAGDGLRLMATLREWATTLYPGYELGDVMDAMVRISSKSRVKNAMAALREQDSIWQERGHGDAPGTALSEHLAAKREEEALRQAEEEAEAAAAAEAQVAGGPAALAAGATGATGAAGAAGEAASPAGPRQ